MKKLIDELRMSIGKRCEMKYATGDNEFHPEGEILEVYEDGFIKIKKYDNKEIFCNIRMFHTIEITE